MRKKLLSVIMILAMLICMLPVTVPEKVEAKSSDAPTTKYANLVIFAHFKDRKEDANFYTENRDEIIKLFNGPQNRSAVNYLKTVSYGKFEMVNIFPQDDGKTITSVEVPVTYAEAENSNMDYTILHSIITSMPDITDEMLDYDGDGCIDNVTVVLRGGGDADDSDTSLVSHKNDYASNEKWMGKYVGTYNFLNTHMLIESSIPSGAGVIVHEFMHSLGYPDLYLTNSNFYEIQHPVYVWDMMASANFGMSLPLAYLRMHFSGWLDIDTVTESSTGLHLDNQYKADGNQAFIIKSPLNEHEFFVAEFRQKTYGQDTYDRFIGSSGIIVYRINPTVTGLYNNRGGTGVYVFRPQPGQTGYNESENVCVANAALSVENGRTQIGSANMEDGLTDGALTFSDGSNSGIVIKNVSSAAGDYMTFDVEIPEAADYDLWKNTSFPDGNSEDYYKTLSLAQCNGTIYASAFTNGKIRMYAYEDGKWTQKGNPFSASYIYGMQLVNVEGTLYLAYYDYTDINLLKWNGTAFTKGAVISGASSEPQVAVEGGKIWISYLKQGSSYIESKATLAVFEKGALSEKGTYSTGMIGQPDIAVCDGTVYVSVRNSSNSDKIELCKYESGTFVPVEYSGNANTYDMTAVGSKLYIMLGASNGGGLILDTYTGGSWSCMVSDITEAFPKIVSSQGNLYSVASSATGNGHTKCYRYDDINGCFVREGLNVDTEGSNFSVLSDGKTLYVGLLRTYDNTLAINCKDSSNALVSLSIVPPDKTSYVKGEKINTDGLLVYANYVKGSRLLDVSDYEISNFSTEKTGRFDAIVTYEGKTNSFTYNVYDAIAEDDFLTGKCGDNAFWEFDDAKGALRIYGSGAVYAYEKKELVPWYSFLGQIKSVDFGDGITETGSNLFYGAGNLTKVTGMKDVVLIGKNTFKNCKNLVSVEGCTKVREVLEAAFCNCYKLTKAGTVADAIRLPSIEVLGDFAFANCKGEKELFTGGKLSSIGIYAFKGNEALESAYIGSKCTSIGGSAFMDDKNLVAVKGMAGIKSISASAFRCCEKLETVEGCSLMTFLGQSAFYQNTMLNTVGSKSGYINMPSLTAVGKYTFYQCESIERFAASSALTFIGNTSFRGCLSLEYVTGTTHVTIIDDYAFREDAKLKSVSGCARLTRVGNYAFYNCGSLNKIGGVEGKMSLPKVSVIGMYAFGKNYSMTYFEAGESLTEIGAYAFTQNKAALHLYFKGTNVQSVGEKCFLELNSKCIIHVPAAVNGLYENKGQKSSVKIENI